MAYRRGFTFAEVLVSLVIISTVSVAALKLCALAELGIAEARSEKELVRDAQYIRTELLVGDMPDSGVSGDIAWENSPAEEEMMGKDFGELDLDGIPRDRTVKAECMELTVTKKMRSGKVKTITLYAPAKESNDIQKEPPRSENLQKKP